MSCLPPLTFHPLDQCLCGLNPIKNNNKKNYIYIYIRIIASVMQINLLIADVHRSMLYNLKKNYVHCTAKPYNVIE